MKIERWCPLSLPLFIWRFELFRRSIRLQLFRKLIKAVPPFPPVMHFTFSIFLVCFVFTVSMAQSRYPAVLGVQSCPTLCDPVGCSSQASGPSPTPRAGSNSCPSVSEAIQPSHPLSSSSPPALSLSQHQGLF